MAKEKNEGWEEIAPIEGDVHDFEEDKVLIGVYLGKEEGVGPNESMLYSFEKKGGKKVVVWGSTLLDSRFKSLEIGEEVKVEYIGKATSEKTGREYKNYKVWHRNQK